MGVSMNAENCPHCGKKCQYAEYAFNNAVTYRNDVVVLTTCCDNFVRLSPVYYVSISKSNGRDDFDGPVDDWGLSRKNSVDS
jgi:hypothetical protein